MSRIDAESISAQTRADQPDQSPTAAAAVTVRPFSRLAAVELQLVMRYCDQPTLIALARCSRFTLAAASRPFVWQPLSPIALRCDWPLELSSRISKSLLRHADISVTWKLRSKVAVSADQVAALAALPRMHGLAIEPACDPDTNHSADWDDEGVALLFEALCEQIDRGLMLARLEFSSLGIGQAGGAALAAFIERSRTLTTLKATCTSNLPLSALASSLAHCRTLTSLEVHAFCSSPETIRALATAVQHSGSLTTLRLAQLKLDDAAAATALADAVAHSRSLTDLQLLDCNVDDANAEMLAAALEQSGRIRKLDVSFNLFGSVGAAALARLLASDRCALSSLDVSTNMIGRGGALALAVGLQTSRTLTELRLDCSGIDSDGTSAVVAALRNNPHCRLRVLDLSDSVISQQAAAALAELMQRSGTLEQLEVKDCSLTDAAMMTLADAIGLSRTLQHLDVSDNEFSTAGAAALAVAVGACPALNSLDVSGNSIGDAGLAALAPALLNMRSLAFNNCRLTLSSAKPLAELIERSRVLESLTLGKTTLESRGISEIAAALHPSSSLRTLLIQSENEVGADGVAALAGALSRGWKASTLRLDVSRSIDDRGAVALAEALEQLGSRCTLTMLSLCRVGITGAGALALVRAAMRTPRLRTLDLRYNRGITAADRSALIAACGPQPHFELSLSSSSD